MKKTARFAAVAAIAALALTACGDARRRGRRRAAPVTRRSRGDARPKRPSSSPTSRRAWCRTRAASTTSRSTRPRTTVWRTPPTSYGVQTAEVESNDRVEFADNIQSLVDEGCNQITTVGFLLGDATLAAAKENKDIDFAIVDFAYSTRTAQLARQPQGPDLQHRPAGVPGRLPRRGEVRVRRGRHLRWPQHPDGDHLHDGFAQGVEYYNEENGAERPGARLGPGEQGRLVHRGLRGQDQGPEHRRGADRAGRRRDHPGRRSRRPRRPPGRPGQRRLGASGSTPTAASRPPSTATRC